MAGVDTTTIPGNKYHCDKLRALRLFPESDVIRYADSNHSNAVLLGLNQLRTERHFTDIVLRVGQEKFACHRNVLASCSPYFRAMFTIGMQESCESEVTLCDVDPKSVRVIVDFAYSGVISLNQDNVQSVFAAANLLQVLPVVGFCAEYMAKNLHVSNCVDMYQLASMYSCARLREAAWDYLNYHIQDVLAEPQLVHANLDVITDLVRSDKLNVMSDETVLKMVLKWVQWDLMNRRMTLTALLENIRFKHITHDKLEESLDLGTTDEMIYRAVKKAFVVNSQDVGGEQLEPRLGYLAQDVVLLTGRICGEHIVCCYHPPTQTSFFVNLPLLCKTFGAKLVVTETNDIYVATNDYRQKSVFRYNHVQSKWIQISPMLQGRSNFSFVALRDKIFALGGLNDWEVVRSIEWYDPGRDQWQFANSMPRDVIDFCATAFQNTIYVFSGSRTMSYDSETDTWVATLPPMPTPRLQAACTPTGSEIWLIGGFPAQSSSEVPTVNVESFEPKTQTWTKKASLPSLLRFCSAIQYRPNTRVYLCGMWCGVHEMGLNIPMQLSSQFDLYDFDELTNSWADIAFDIPMHEVESCAVARVFKRSKSAGES